MVLSVLVGTRFQVLFHSPSGVLFTFPSRYWFTIGRWGVFRLGGRSRQIPAGLHVSCGTQVPTTPSHVSPTGLSPSLACRPKQFDSRSRYDIVGPTTPVVSLRRVWPFPRSLATTRGISVDFCSSGYLDVSVHRVRFLWPMYSARDTPCGVGFPIRKSADQSLFASSPQLIAGYNVLLRL